MCKKPAVCTKLNKILPSPARPAAQQDPCSRAAPANLDFQNHLDVQAETEVDAPGRVCVTRCTRRRDLQLCPHGPEPLQSPQGSRVHADATACFPAARLAPGASLAPLGEQRQGWNRGVPERKVVPKVSWGPLHWGPWCRDSGSPFLGVAGCCCKRLPGSAVRPVRECARVESLTQKRLTILKRGAYAKFSLRYKIRQRKSDSVWGMPQAGNEPESSDKATYRYGRSCLVKWSVFTYRIHATQFP